MASEIIARFGSGESSKVCTKCQTDKPLSEFNLCSKHGYQRYCRECQRSKISQFRAENREHIRDYRRDNPWSPNTPEQLEKSKKRIAKWAIENPESRRETYKKYREGNHEEGAVIWRDWYAKNTDHMIAKANARRAAKINAIPQWADPQRIGLIYREARRLSVETGIKMHVDHIVPLKSKLVCGLHCEANLRVIPWRENLSKKNSFWPDMP